MVIYYDKNSVRLSHMNYVEYLSAVKFNDTIR